MRCLIAGLMTEFEPRYDETVKLAKPFEYEGERETDISLSVSDEELENLQKKMVEGTTVGATENFLLSSVFMRKAITRGVMLLHASALVVDGGAYLFSAQSGVGKSTHTRLWLSEFGDAVHILNDDKPVLKIGGDSVTVCGTPFDGGSGIALNESCPLRAIIFLERGERNSVSRPDKKRILRELYFATAHRVGRVSAEAMLDNFERLMALTEFYVLTCNMEPEAAHVAYDAIIGSK